VVVGTINTPDDGETFGLPKGRFGLLVLGLNELPVD
jgi:hypothetical protein